MSLPNGFVEPEDQGVWPYTSRALTVGAWVVIVGLVSLVVAVRQTSVKEEPATVSRDQLVLQELFGRIVVGARRMLDAPPEEIEQLMRSYPADSAASRLTLAIMEGELHGPLAALVALKKVDAAGGDVALLRQILERLYSDYLELRLEAPSVTVEDRRVLRDKLDWFAALALHPRQPALEQVAAAAGAPAALAMMERWPAPEGRNEALEPAVQTMTALSSGVAGVVLLAFGGLICLTVVFNLARQGRLQQGIGPPVRYAGLYAETFALWLLVFLGLSTAVPLLFPALDIMEAGGTAMALSLVALGYPVARGLSWRQVREDVGWTTGERPAFEPMAGLLTYMMSLPLMIAGLACFAIYAAQLGTLIAAEAPSHPIVEFLIRADGWSRFKIYFLACVLAPVVEETMFRGVLYRHLRDVTRQFGGPRGFIAAGLIASFLFALLHPQGPLAVPALAALGFGFTIGREWRGTVLPSMLAHCLANGVILTIAIQALKG